MSDFAVRFIRDWDITADQQPSRYDARVILMSHYTAQQVRALVSDCKYFEDVNGRLEMDPIEAALMAYADRLEHDETWKVNPDTVKAFAEVREEGRREVYREIAAMDPMVFEELGVACPACGRGKNHAPDCLWLRATAALRETTPTP